MPRTLLIRAFSLLLVLAGAYGSQQHEKQREAQWLDQLQTVVNSRIWMDARYAGGAEPPGSRLPHLVGSQRWAECQEDEGPLFAGACGDVVMAAVFFPPASAVQGRRLVQNWRGTPYPAPVAAAVISWFAGTAELSAPEREARDAALAILLGNPGDSVSVLAELGARAATPPKLPALATVASEIRRGEEVDPAVLAQPGLAGLAALEWGKRGDPGRIPQLLQLSVHGPAAPDRLAALYAALRLADGVAGLRAYGDCPDCAAAIARAERL